MRVAVLGPGGVGAFIAAALDRAGTSVTLVARPETAAAIDGIHVESVRLGDFVAHPRVVSELSEPVDALIVATKAVTLEDALDRVRAAPRLVVPLLNGLDHIPLLRERFGERVVAASIRIVSERVAPGHVVHTSRFLQVETQPRAAALAEELRRAGIPAQLIDSEAQILWGKLVRLNALALTTSAFELPLGSIRERHPEALEGSVVEGARVAAAEGASIRPETVMEEIADAHAELTTSMARDIAAGIPSELDAIAGAVLRAAGRHEIECPTISRLAARAAERARVAPP